MTRVANINGKAINSDKRVSEIFNTRVTFTDGSWCDVSTGDIHNAGSGYINIDGSDQGNTAKSVTIGPKSVAASALDLSYINANVRVDVHDGVDIEYTITGPSDLVEAIKTRVDKNTLVLHGGSSSSSQGGLTIIQSGSSSVVISGSGGSGSIMNSVVGRGKKRSIFFGNDASASAVKITIKVPLSTPIEVNRPLGDVTIGDTRGTLRATIQGATDVRAGKVGDVQLNVQGSGDIYIKEVKGSATAQVQGSGDIEIKSGDITSLTATVQGSGDIAVGGSATTANLTVQGSGDIKVAHVRQRPVKNVMGFGDIKVRRVG